jgi:hypothetical protein
MRNDGRWIRAPRTDGDAYRIAFGPLLRFAVVRRPRAEARLLWTVYLNDRELDWSRSLDEAVERVEQEARTLIAPTLEAWQTFKANPPPTRVPSPRSARS